MDILVKKGVYQIFQDNAEIDKFETKDIDKILKK
jgi:hypothetical protein